MPVPIDPIFLANCRLLALSLTVKDLEPIIGRSNRVDEVLSGKRSLTLPVIRRLYSMLGIPANSLIA